MGYLNCGVAKCHSNYSLKVAKTQLQHKYFNHYNRYIMNYINHYCDLDLKEMTKVQLVEIGQHYNATFGGFRKSATKPVIINYIIACQFQENINAANLIAQNKALATLDLEERTHFDSAAEAVVEEMARLEKETETQSINLPDGCFPLDACKTKLIATMGHVDLRRHLKYMAHNGFEVALLAKKTDTIAVLRLRVEAITIAQHSYSINANDARYHQNMMATRVYNALTAPVVIESSGVADVPVEAVAIDTSKVYDSLIAQYAVVVESRIDTELEEIKEINEVHKNVTNYCDMHSTTTVWYDACHCEPLKATRTLCTLRADGTRCNRCLLRDAKRYKPYPVG